MALLRLARHAMATRFEMVLPGDDWISLRAAGEEALDEIERLEDQLSLFKPTSEIAHLNARAAHEPVRVTPALFSLLEHARQLTAETQGAFDITIAPLVRCWGFMGGAGHLPQPDELAAARSKIGMHMVQLDPDRLTVRFQRDGVMLDLGAIGKGYAIERAVELLREAGVSSALIHGGTSSIYGLGHPPETDSWTIEIPSPASASSLSWMPSPAFPIRNTEARPDAKTPEWSAEPFATVFLRDASLSVSAVWGKSFQSEGRSFGHIIDPRTGEPAGNSVMSAIALDSATETDALSTALLTLGPGGHDHIAKLRPGMRTLVAARSGDRFEIRSQGIPFKELC